MSTNLVKRNAESVIIETLADTPVTVIQGARQVGNCRKICDSSNRRR